jgi:acetyl-CoA carboxylase biotin carboxyl carrier protein
VTIDEIKELIRVVLETGIAELEVRRGENSVRIRHGAQAASHEYLVGAQAAAVQPAKASSDSYGGILAAAPMPAAEERDVEIQKSPIVGTYYDTPEPGAPPFVKVGDAVELKQVLCIIESMKLMNPIEAEFAGTVISKYVDNGKPVEYGEALIAIRPR